MRTDEVETHFDVPEAIRVAFQGRVFLAMGATANLLGINVKTLARAGLPSA